MNNNSVPDSGNALWHSSTIQMRSPHGDLCHPVVLCNTSALPKAAMAGVTMESDKSRPPMTKRNSSLLTKKKRRKKPSITSSDLDQFPSKSRHYVAPMDKQVLFQDITNEFAEWTSWQRRLLICRLTEKTSSALLSTLSTVLEPIFHRDFEVRAKDGFDSSLIKTIADIKRTSFGSSLPGVSSSFPDVGQSFPEVNSLPGQSLIAIVEPTCLIPPPDEPNKLNKHGNIDSSSLHSNPDKDSGESQRAKPPPDAKSSFTGNHSSLHNQSALNATERPVSPSPLTNTSLRPVSPRPITNSTQRSISPVPSHNQERFLGVSRKAMRKKSSTLKKSDMESLTTLAQGGFSSVLRTRGTSHAHEEDRNSTSMSTLQFVSSAQKQKMDKLGKLLKPRASSKNGLTSVRQYKPHKLWLPPINNNKNLMLKKPSKTALLQSFKAVMEKFLDRYILWSNAEKGDFLLHVVDYCQPDEIKFFASCIYQRIESISDINSLTDDLLLKILNCLSVDDLGKTMQVNKKWLELSTSSKIWERNCFELAARHNQVDVIESLESSVLELDWKQLYGELKDSIEFLKAVCAQKEADQKLQNELQVPMSSFGNASWQNISGRNSTLNEGQNIVRLSHNKMSESLSMTGEEGGDVSPTIATDPFLIENSSRNTKVLLGVRPAEEILPAESKPTLDDHVRFCMEKNESTLQVMLGSIDRMAEDYVFEEDLLNKVNETVQDDEKDQDDKDVAFDVRLRLIQAADKLATKSVFDQIEDNIEASEDDEDEEEDYQVMQISNIKTVNCVRKLEGHLDSVLCLQFDSKRVMTGSSDRTVRLWDIRSGRCFQTLVGHQGGVRCLQFDEKYIITGSWDTTIIVWNVINFNLICTIVEHSDCVSCIELTPNTLITASFDTTVCIFEKNTWILLSRLTEHSGPVSCMCLLTSSELLTGSHDKSLLLWNLEENHILKSFKGMNYPCLCAKVCGGLIAAGCSDGTVTFWDISSGTLEGCISAHMGPVNAICFVHMRFYTAGGDVIKEWDLSTCACLRSLQGHSGVVYCLRASAKRIVSGSGDATTRIWDMASKLQQVGRNYDELNKNIIPAQVVNEHQYKKMTSAK